MGSMFLFPSLRDSTKTILKADGQVVNGMVTFSQAQEHEQITLYAFDNSDRKKRGKSDTAKGSNTIISGYQAKFLKVTLVDVQGNKEVTKMDVAQFVGLKSIRHTLYFQNDFACINLIVSLIGTTQTFKVLQICLSLHKQRQLRTWLNQLAMNQIPMLSIV